MRRGGAFDIKLRMMQANIHLTEKQITEILAQIRAQGCAEKAFDVNLAEGRVSEQWLNSILKSNDKIEIKTDYKVSETGNVAIEFEDRGKPSGIKTTRAEWWCIVLAGDIYEKKRAILIRTEELLQIAQTCHIISGGDNDEAKSWLVPLNKLLKPIKIGQMFLL